MMTVRGTIRCITLTATACLSLLFLAPVLAQEGVTATVIRIGGVMDLEGDSRGLGLAMKAGIEAALHDQQVGGRRVEYVAVNDFYDPDKTVTAIQQLLDQGVFAMLGNVGTPTARAALPLLAKHQIPAVGFFTGADLLRPGSGDIINFRASYVQETATVIGTALAAGVKPAEICAFVQDDAYGMAGVAGIRKALANRPDTTEIVTLLDTIIKTSGDKHARNHQGPVGTYERNTLATKEGYESLKSWETVHGQPCRLVVTVGTYSPVARFIAYAHSKNEPWIISAVSFTGADNLARELTQLGIRSNVIMTQVVPPLNATLPIAVAARNALGSQFNYVSFEGYIAARMLLALLNQIDGEPTRAGLMAAAHGNHFDLDGLNIDFTDDNQGSDYVLMTYLQDNGFAPVESAFLQQVFQ